MKTADFILDYYRNLNLPQGLPSDVEVLMPFTQKEVDECLHQFYKRFYAGDKKRIFLIGINPGRKGAGITGIPFTDPINLEEELGIVNPFPKKHELSSVFIYELIKTVGGAEFFYENFHFSSVSPVGFVKDGKNLNYYDISGFREILEEYMVEEMNKQVSQIARRDVAFSLGKGQNIKYLKELNKKHHWFEKIEALPHPRWVMQYRLKLKDEILTEIGRELIQFTS